MNLSHRARNQIILSRQLLTSPDYQDFASPDPSLLIRDLIICHGSAELALAAICIQLDCVPAKKEIILTDYYDSLWKRTNPELAAQEMDFVAELHKVRLNSQLRSLLPDPRRWTRAKQETLEHLATWCQQFLDLSLADLDSLPSVSSTLPVSPSEASASNKALSQFMLYDPDRRRYECFGSVDIRLALAGRSEKGTIANVSAGGCYVKTDFPIEVGEQVEMTLHVNMMSFRVTGSVIHVPSLVAAGPRKASSSGMGVKFMNMSAGARLRLQELIDDLKTNGIFRFRKRAARP